MNLYVPKNGASKIHVMLHQTHPGVAWPALFVVVADDVLIVRVGMFCEIALDEISSFVCREAEEDPDAFHIATIESDRVGRLRSDIFERKKLIGALK